MINIIPAIDIIEEKCVRLTQGDYERKTIYNEDPIEVALAFEDAGVNRLHLVDLDGARAGKLKNQKVLEKIANATKMVIDFGGGIKTESDVRSVFSAGASIAAIGSIAAKSPEIFKEWIKIFGGDKFFLGADVKNENIVVSGWAEQTKINILDFINEYVKCGVKNIFCTDISKDGMMQGPATSLYRTITNNLVSYPEGKDARLAASGGIRSLKDVDEVEKAGCAGAIVGKAIYEGKITMKELKTYLKN